MDEQIVKVSGRKKTTSKNSAGGDCCGLGGCHDSSWHCHHCFLILRWFLGLVILVLVFGLGMKIGELKAQFRMVHFGGYERGWYGMNHNSPQRMMIDRGSFPVTVSVDEKETATSSKTKK